MNKKTKKAPAGIALRMLLLMIAFIILIFAAIFLSFNFFIGDYVERDMTGQLVNAVQGISQNRDAIIFNSQAGFDFINGAVLIDPVKLYNNVVRYIKNTQSNSEVNIIYCSDDYARLYPSDDDLLNNPDEMNEILDIIKTRGYTEENIRYKIPAASGTYYLTAVNLGLLFEIDNYSDSAVFYVNLNKYDNFIKNIYFMLLTILIVAMFFTILYVLFISRSISKPIKKLCSFADEIGHGNFKRSEYSFRDRELIDLNGSMNETAAKLAKNDEDQKIFFQNVSHELKTPLMSIRGYAEGIKYKVFDEEKDMNNAADIIISESERLNELVSDLLYISKMDSSDDFTKHENTANTNLVKLAENCAEKLKGLLINNNKNINVIRPAKDIYINCFEENLMRALMNIIANGVQYAKTIVEISFYETEKSVFLYIRDDGPGIDEHDLPNIFRRFYKGKNGRHGIGLSIAKSVIERHGAKIIAGNRLDRESGAEFIIEFDKNM